MSDPTPESVNPPPGNSQGADAQQRPVVSIQKVYVKDLSLEIPHAPQIFAEQTQPQLEVQISTQAAKLSDTHYEVGVSARVTARVGERTLFLAEVLGPGIFLLPNTPRSGLEPVLAISCPT